MFRPRQSLRPRDQRRLRLQARVPGPLRMMGVRIGRSAPPPRPSPAAHAPGLEIGLRRLLRFRADRRKCQATPPRVHPVTPLPHRAPRRQPQHQALARASRDGGPNRCRRRVFARGERRPDALQTRTPAATSASRSRTPSDRPSISNPQSAFPRPCPTRKTAANRPKAILALRALCGAAASPCWRGAAGGSISRRAPGRRPNGRREGMGQNAAGFSLASDVPPHRRYPPFRLDAHAG